MSEVNMVSGLALRPSGIPYLLDQPDGVDAIEPSVDKRIRASFDKGPFHGILHLGAVENDSALPASLAFGRSFGKHFVSALCAQPNLDERRDSVEPAFPDKDVELLADVVPPMLGGEYVRLEILRTWWEELTKVAHEELAAHPGPVQDLLHSWNPIWSLVGRVWFHLAENKKHPTAPFAFMATYTARVGDHARPQHVPLGKALKEYAGQGARNRLLALLAPVHKASEISEVARRLVDSGEIFHPLAWKPDEALLFLHDIPLFESAGVLVRVPDWWSSRRPPRPSVKVTVGSSAPSVLGVGTLLDFSVEATIDGEPMTTEEWNSILQGTDGLVLLKGRWVEVDRDKLSAVLERWRTMEKHAERDGIGFLEAMRLLADQGELEAGNGDSLAWSEVSAGAWLADVLGRLREPESAKKLKVGKGLNASLRPYQQVGVRWLHTATSLGLGACLADDMGLGKTMQVLALLLLLRRERPGPSLLVAPASLLGNWKAELETFAPDLVFRLAHASATPEERVAIDETPDLRNVDLVMTTYGSTHRFPWMREVDWNVLVLDEAQAIKNPGARQTHAVKALRSRARLCLTGTPIENRLSDLWSLFDFLLPGLLGSAKKFSAQTKRMERAGSYAPLRRLVGPYILRRLKTDPKVIDDLPDKTEMTVWCPLSRKQAVLYQHSVDDLAVQLEEAEGMERRGKILAYLMRFKQICNHPSQWLGDGDWSLKASGKLSQLEEIVAQVSARQEKMLVFTQFREATAPLERHLSRMFGRSGLVLHGQVPVKKRKALVDAFQREDGPPFFVLSLKAGGTGLNLTAASHVVHFDRWWNPAVENQATDRAYRIGQKRNVLVHKLVCRGTIEERIDKLIASKRALAEEVVGDGAGKLLTEMSNAEILKLVTLDLASATMDGD
jgi:SNF2-related domain/SNF2 Helicase protein/Helicase conserved C-terminal domain